MFKTIVFSALVAAVASSCIDDAGLVGYGYSSDLGLVGSRVGCARPAVVTGCSSGLGRIVSNNCQCQKVIQSFRPVSQVISRPTERRVVQTSTRNIVQRIPYSVNVGSNTGPSVCNSNVAAAVLPIGNLGFNACNSGLALDVAAPLSYGVGSVVGDYGYGYAY